MWHIHTITQSAIEFLTSCFTSFHFLTPISGVLNLVYIITSSTNVRLLSPHGPPSFAENSTLSFEKMTSTSWPDAEALSRYHGQLACHLLTITWEKFIQRIKCWFNCSNEGKNLKKYELNITLCKLRYFPSMRWPFCFWHVTAAIALDTIWCILIIGNISFVSHCQKMYTRALCRLSKVIRNNKYSKEKYIIICFRSLDPLTIQYKF